MFWVDVFFGRGVPTSRVFTDDGAALRFAIDRALEFPGCAVAMRRDNEPDLVVQCAEDDGGRPLESDLVAFLGSRSAWSAATTSLPCWPGGCGLAELLRTKARHLALFGDPCLAPQRAEAH